MDQRAGKRYFLSHAAGIALNQIVAFVLEFKQMEQGFDAFRPVRADDGVEIGHEMEIFAAAQFLVEERIVRNIAEQALGFERLGLNVATADLRRAGTGPQKSRYHLNG